MSALTKQQFFLARTRVTETIRIPLRLTAVVASLLLTMMPLLTGCGGGESGSVPSPTSVGVNASLAWSPVQDSSIHGYFVYYGRQSQDQQGSCSYENSMFVDSPSATVINLEPSTLYYFAVSAYNGLESACSHEVSTVTPQASVQTDPRDPSRAPEMPTTTTDPRDPSRAPEMPITTRPGVSDSPGQRPL